VAGASKNVGALYRVLADSADVRRFLVTTAAAAPDLARALARNMDILDALLEDPEEILGQNITAEAAFRKLMTTSKTDTVEQQSQLRAAIDRRLLAAWSIDLRDHSFPNRMIAALTEMTHALVQTGFDTLLSNKDQVALFALGSYAVAEPRPASDVDLLVVSTEAQLETTTREVQRLNTLLGGFGLLKLDFRLRGEGANAPLVQSLDYYTRYFSERMAPWETVAFAKANAWAGSSDVADTFIARLMPLLHATPDRDTVRSLTKLRARLETLAGDAATFDTKRVRGGRYDIEYVIALSMRQRGKPFDLDASTTERIALLVEDGIVSVAEQKTMTDALAVAAKLDYVLALAGGSVDVDYVDRTLSLLGASIGGPVTAVLASARKAVRSVYVRLVKDLPG